MMHLKDIRDAVTRRIVHPSAPDSADAAETSAEASVAAPPPMRADWKRRTLDDFARWLESLPDAEPLDACDSDDDAPPAADLVTLIGETAALRQEMRLMGRGTGKLLKTVEQVAGDVTATVLPLADEIKRLDRDARTAESRNLLRPLLLDMGDLLDALNEARAKIADPPLPWYVPARVRKHADTQGLRDVLDLLTQRIEAILRRHDVNPVATVKMSFDAACMTADGVSRDGAVAPGHVSAVVRQGFTLAGAVLRPAHVMVEQEEKHT